MHNMNELELRNILIELYPDKDNSGIDLLIEECKNNEGAWDILRKERNKRLLESDWTQVSDYNNGLSLEKKNEWALYRQELRDLPINIDFPGFVTYPINPNGEL